jgi:gas vesicle protein
MCAKLLWYNACISVAVIQSFKNNNRMSNSKFVAGLILGAAAGVFIAIFANSDKGQELIDTVKDKASDLTDSVKDSVKSTYSDTSDEVSDWIEKGKKFLSMLEGKAKDVKSKAKDVADAATA